MLDLFFRKKKFREKKTCGLNFVNNLSSDFIAKINFREWVTLGELPVI